MRIDYHASAGCEIVVYMGYPGSKNASCPDDEHANIMKAILARDPDQAEALLLSHLGHIQSGLDMDARPQPQDDLAVILGLAR